MATLNTLRTRGGIIVSIVIGLALLAFLFGDLAGRGTSMMNERKSRVGEVNGTVIGYVEYTEQIAHFTAIAQSMSGKESLSTQENEMVKNSVWELMITKYAYRPGFEKMGLSACEAEQFDMVNGVYISPVISQIFVNQNTGQYDPEMVKNFVSRIGSDQTGRLAAVWDYNKQQMIDQRVMTKYYSLLSKGQFVTDLEIEAGVTTANNKYSVDYVKLDYSIIPDLSVEATNAEMKKWYAAHEIQYKQGASRDINYVSFDLVPSTEDFAQAKTYIDEIATEFATSATPLQYAKLSSSEQIDQRYVKRSDIDPEIAQVVLADRKAMYGPALNGDVYTIARFSEEKNLPDSIGAKHILVPATDTQLADSLVNVLKSGGDFAALSAQYSMDKQANQRGGDLGIFPPEYMIPEFSEACVKANKGDIFTITTQYGVHVVQLTYKSALTPKFQIAQIKYKVQPSDVTQQIMYGKASAFVTKVAGVPENFVKVALEDKLPLMEGNIANRDREILGLKNSGEIVRWAFNGEKGDISQILEIDGNYILAIISQVKEDGIAPFEQVKEAVRTAVIKEKKFEQIAKKVAGATSIAEVASKEGVEVVKIDSIKMSDFYINGLGIEQRFIGAICGSKQGIVSKPVKGTAGVFVFAVTNVANSEQATFESEKVKLEATTNSYISERARMALEQKAEIKDWRVKFF